MSPKRSLWFTFMALTLISVLILPILTACGSSDEKDTSTPSATTTSITTAATTGTSEATVTGNEWALPILSVGDKWVMKIISGSNQSTATTEVIGEEVVDGIDCYISTISMDPYSSKEWVDKTTLFPIKNESSGGTTTYSYKFMGDMLYPLQKGKECQVSETVTSTTKDTGESNTATDIYTFKVENIEQITVPAGTFECFKIVMYDKDNTPVITEWESDATKMYMVKGADPQNNITTELVSYSVSK
jgi:hypothetical protein